MDELAAWATRSSAAIPIGRAICGVAACGFAISAAIVFYDLVSGDTIHRAGLLLVAGVPALIAGQIWGILVLQARQPDRSRDPRAFFFDGLPTPLASALVVVAALGWLDAMIAWGHSPQRFASSILAGFFAIQCGMAAAELARRRSEASTAR